MADDVVTYRLRVDLSGTEPPLWRQLEVVSDLFLDELHWMIWVAFGRDDCHLHEVTAGRGWNTEVTPEDEVRLDQVLVRPGDKLSGWAHRIKLEAVLPRSESISNARYVAGQPDRRAG